MHVTIVLDYHGLSVLSIPAHGRTQLHAQLLKKDKECEFGVSMCVCESLRWPSIHLLLCSLLQLTAHMYVYGHACVSPSPLGLPLPSQ